MLIQLYGQERIEKVNLKKENYDMSDAYACVLGYMKQNKFWD